MIELKIEEISVVDGKESKKELPANFTTDGTSIKEVPTSNIILNKAYYDREAGTYSIELLLGGPTKEGDLLINPSYKEVKYTFSRKFTRKVWEKYNLDFAPPTLSILFDMMKDEPPMMDGVASQIWGIPKFEVTKITTTEIATEVKEVEIKAL